MNTIQINYDLVAPGRSYQPLYDAIKAIANGYARPLESMWLIRTRMTASEVRDYLKAYVDSNDKVLTINVTGDGWATSFSDAHTTWMKGHMKVGVAV